MFSEFKDSLNKGFKNLKHFDEHPELIKLLAPDKSEKFETKFTVEKVSRDQRVPFNIKEQLHL